MQNDFVYGELWRTSFQNNRFFMIFKYCLNSIASSKTKYKRYIYNMMLEDMVRMQLGVFSYGRIFGF